MAIKVGYQGNHGTFSEIAVMRYFKDVEIEQKNYKNFVEIMEACDKGELDYAMIPVENTTTGIIARTYDLFKDYNVHAIGEMVVKIEEDLIVVPGTKLEDIKEVYSHPEALSQCEKFFLAHDEILAISHQDTAASVEYIKQLNDKSKAALASSRAAEYYEMESLMKCVQDSDTNMTRFLCITSKDEQPQDGNKVSIMLVLNHEPGSLYHAMEVLSAMSINIMKLESRPIVGQPFHYCFYIDFVGNILDPKVQIVLDEIRSRCFELRVLGCYQAYNENSFRK